MAKKQMHQPYSMDHPEVPPNPEQYGFFKLSDGGMWRWKGPGKEKIDYYLAHDNEYRTMMCSCGNTGWLDYLEELEEQNAKDQEDNPGVRTPERINREKECFNTKRKARQWRKLGQQ